MSEQITITRENGKWTLTNGDGTWPVPSTEHLTAAVAGEIQMILALEARNRELETGVIEWAEPDDTTLAESDAALDALESLDAARHLLDEAAHEQ